MQNFKKGGLAGKIQISVSTNDFLVSSHGVLHSKFTRVKYRYFDHFDQC